MKKKKLTNRVVKPKKLAYKLRQIRFYLKFSQGDMVVAINPKEIAENRSKVSQYERGLRIPNVIELLNYSRLSGVTMEVLVDDDQFIPKKIGKAKDPDLQKSGK